MSGKDDWSGWLHRVNSPATSALPAGRPWRSPATAGPLRTTQRLAIPHRSNSPPDEPPRGNPPPPPPPGDRDRRLFETIYANHADTVFKTLQRYGVRRHDLVDQAQEVFCAVYRNLYKFDQTKPVGPWLYSICRKIACRYRRNAYIRRVLTVDICSFWEKACNAMTPEQNFAMQEEQDELQELLDSLDPDKRIVFVMYEIEEKSCDEIAQEVGIPLGTVHSRLNAARKALLLAFKRREAKRSRKGDK